MLSINVQYAGRVCIEPGCGGKADSSKGGARSPKSIGERLAWQQAPAFQRAWSPQLGSPAVFNILDVALVAIATPLRRSV